MSDTNSSLTYGRAQTVLHEAWSDLLGMDTVTPSSNFYSEGGTSLIAAAILDRMRGSGSRARLAELMTCTTFSEQLELFRAGQADLNGTHESGLSVRQELRLDQIARQVKASGTADVKPLELVLEITGDLDHELLIHSMVDLVQRHDVLNIGFINRQGEIAPARTAVANGWKPEKIDLSAFSIEQARARVWQLIADTEDQGLAFDTTALILGAVAVIRPSLSIVILVVDHMVCDADSLDILFDDLVQIYSAKVAGHPPSLPDLRASAQDALVEADRQRMADWPILAEKWRNLLSGYQAPPAFDLLGTAGARDYSRTIPSSAKVSKFVLSAGTATELRASYRQLGLPPLSIMLGATYLAAHAISGGQDICIINPYSRRYAVGATHIVNDFSEASIIRIRYLGTSCPCQQTMAEVAAMAASSYAAATQLEMPFDVIRQAISRDGARASAEAPYHVVPWLWCNYRNAGPRSRGMGEAVATMLDAPIDGEINALNFGVYIEDDGNYIQVSAVTPEKLYSSSVISEFGSALERILQKFAKSSDDPMATSCLATAVSRG